VPTEGEPIDARFTKWGGGRHWEFSLRCVGVDEHGVWGAGEVVDLARRTADEVLAAIWDSTEPFGAVGASWLDRLSG
jgi:uncharacterized protein